MGGFDYGMGGGFNPHGAGNGRGGGRFGVQRDSRFDPRYDQTAVPAAGAPGPIGPTPIGPGPVGDIGPRYGMGYGGR